MTYLQNEEMRTHLYLDNIDTITEGDDTIMTAAIDAAMQEARGYLGAYDRDAIFSAQAEQRNALLLVFIKDIAAWHFLVLCNAGHELKLRQARYERAVAWLRAVQKGDVVPDLPVTGSESGEGTDIIKYGSNAKREQHF